MDNSGNLTGGQLFLALDTGVIVTKHQWVVLPMPLLVIDHVNILGWHEPSILTFTNRHGQNIGDNSQDADSSWNEDEESIVEYPTNTPGVALDTENAELTGVDPDFAVKPSGVEMDSEAQGYVPEEHNRVDGLGQQDPSKRFDVPTAEPTTVSKVSSSPAQAVSPKKGMAVHNARLRKKPEKYVPSMKGNKYTVVLTQIVARLKESKYAMSMAQRSVKLMNRGVHCNADVVGMVMAQLSLTAAIKKWGEKAKYVVTTEKKQLHWRNSYKPKHWRELSKGQKDKHAILESHIFVEEKRDRKPKTRKVIGGNKQCNYITKDDASSPTVSAEAVMLTCVIDTLEGRDIANG